MTEPAADLPAGAAALATQLADALAERLEVLEGYPFGSQATGRAAPHSDVDVAVYAAPEGARDVDHPYGYVALRLRLRPRHPPDRPLAA